MKRSVLSLAWLFLGILAVAAVFMTLGKRESVTNPRLDSYAPSGLSAFGELLRSNGYQVRSTASPIPDLGKDDIAVVCLREDRDSLIGGEASGINRRLSDFAEHGGRLVLLPFDSTFDQSNGSIGQVSVRNTVSGAQAQLMMRHPDYSEPTRFLPGELTSTSIWEGQNEPDGGVITLTRDGKGIVLGVSDGFMATNRYIDKVQNADVLMTSIETVAPKGSRLVIVEGLFAESEPSLIELLGPGAAGVWYQALFLFVVVVFTLGKRFGLPQEVRPIQTGQRELVDAIADTYRRARSTRVACRAAYDGVDREVRKAVKLSSDAPASERDSRIPEPLASEFRRVFEGTIDLLSPQEAFARCRALRRQMSSFLKR
ncbi:MAG: DUF4350 domain-containing protein [Fimbriimonadales bacterium]